MKINFNYYKSYKDMFNIYNLITKINNGYRLYFNTRDKKYYILNINRNYEVCLIFNTFSRNILKELQFSKIENLNKNIKFIESYNENIYEKQIKNLKDFTRNKIQDICYNIERSKII